MNRIKQPFERPLPAEPSRYSAGPRSLGANLLANRALRRIRNFKRATGPKGWGFLVFLIGLSGLAFVGLLDWATGKEISFSILYLLPIGLAAWHGGWRVGAALSVLGASAWFGIDRLGGVIYSHAYIPYWNALVRFGFFLLITYLLTRVRLLTSRLEFLVQQRTSSLELEVNKRKGIEQEMADLHVHEQERLAHELHDNLGAYLAGLAFRAKMIAEVLGQRNAPEFSESSELVHLINTGIEKVRRVARLLVPIERGNQDLESALSRLGEEVERFFGITCSVQTGLNLPKLNGEQAEQLCRIAQEAVRNAIQHARAEELEIKVKVEGDFFYLVIENEGKPWDPSMALPVRGLGLRIMKHRSERIGATLSITRREQGGTCVTCRLPLIYPAPHEGILPLGETREPKQGNYTYGENARFGR